MRGQLFFERIRRHGRGRSGVVGAHGLPPAVEGRPDDYRLAPADLVEDTAVRHHPVAGPLTCPVPLAFLDGTQRYEVVGYVDTAPVVAATVQAAVRLRIDGHFTTVARRSRQLLVGRAEALAAFGARGTGLELEVLTADQRIHPLKELESARIAIDVARGRLEREVGAQFRSQSADWLVVDGVISDNPGWAADPRVIGVSKSHATLPFDGDGLSQYLTIPYAHRSSVFAPSTWRFAPVHSWGLRSWPFEGKDLFHGLIRVEVAVSDDPPAVADLVSRWLLAERVPLARPDPRWDRLLYGVAAVERHLRAQ